MLLKDGKKFTHLYEGSRSPHWNPPGFCKKKNKVRYFSDWVFHILRCCAGIAGLRGHGLQAVLDAGLCEQGVLRLWGEVHYLPAAAPLPGLWTDLLFPVLQPGDPGQDHGLHRYKTFLIPSYHPQPLLPVCFPWYNPWFVNWVSTHNIHSNAGS